MKNKELIVEKLKNAVEILQGMLYAIDKDVEFPLQSDLDELADAKFRINEVEVILKT